MPRPRTASTTGRSNFDRRGRKGRRGWEPPMNADERRCRATSDESRATKPATRYLRCYLCDAVVAEAEARQVRQAEQYVIALDGAWMLVTVAVGKRICPTHRPGETIYPAAPATGGPKRYGGRRRSGGPPLRAKAKRERDRQERGIGGQEMTQETEGKPQMDADERRLEDGQTPVVKLEPLPAELWLLRSVETGLWVPAADDVRVESALLVATSEQGACYAVEHQDEVYDIRCEPVLVWAADPARNPQAVVAETRHTDLVARCYGKDRRLRQMRLPDRAGGRRRDRPVPRRVQRRRLRAGRRERATSDERRVTKHIAG